MESNPSVHQREILAAFRGGDFTGAEKIAQEILADRWNDHEAKSLLKCAVFWKERLDRQEQLVDGISKADYLFRELSGFQTRFLERIGPISEEWLQALRSWVFDHCLKLYLQMGAEEDPPVSDLYFRMGRCLKGLGNYQEALETFEKALSIHRDDPGIMAEMADCYDMMSESRGAKVLFREAFFQNPDRIDLDYIQSPMIQMVVAELQNQGKPPEVLKEWIPVWGTIMGVFSIKRELRPLELGQLKQSIYSLKNEWGIGLGADSKVLPRLLNRYFWLIDHYIAVKEDRQKVEEVLLNIRVLAPEVYELYIK